MHAHQDSRPRQFALASAAVALLLVATGTHALSQSGTPPSASPSSGNQPSDSQPSAAARAALAIAGPASMTVPAPHAAPPQQTAEATALRPTAAPREMTPDQRRQFMMLLILHETSRNPIGTLR